MQGFFRLQKTLRKKVRNATYRKHLAVYRNVPQENRNEFYFSAMPLRCGMLRCVALPVAGNWA